MPCQGADGAGLGSEDGAPRRVVAIALGANLGDAAATIEAASEQLSRGPALSDAVLSGLYGTAPMGPPQPDYVNAVLVAHSTWEPLRLLRHLQAIEAAYGRQRDVRWGARTLDLDLLLVGDAVWNTPELTLPHPGIANRGFVLVPLCDVLPDGLHPTLGVSYRTLLAGWRRRTANADRQVWTIRQRLTRPEVAA